MTTPFSLAHRFRKPKILIPTIALFLCIGLAAAAVFTMYYTTNTATVRTPDVQLAAGSDSTGGTTYPAATVTVASTYDFATIDISLFPSETHTPQPATYYTDLLNINNIGSAAHTISTIEIIDLSGQANLGNITVYYYTTQTDDPDASTAIGSVSLTSGSGATSTVFSGSQAIAASATHYIEVVGYALSTATPTSTITFTIKVQWA